MTVQTFFSKPGSNGIFWGLIGGVSLIVVTSLSKNGYLQIAPYFFILCASILTIKYINKSNADFMDLFKSGLFAFIISSVILYIYVLTLINPDSGITSLGHLWRFGVIVLMGLIGSTIISYLAKSVRYFST